MSELSNFEAVLGPEICFISLHFHFLSRRKSRLYRQEKKYRLIYLRSSSKRFICHISYAKCDK